MGSLPSVCLASKNSGPRVHPSLSSTIGTAIDGGMGTAPTSSLGGSGRPLNYHSSFPHAMRVGVLKDELHAIQPGLRIREARDLREKILVRRPSHVFFLQVTSGYAICGFDESPIETAEKRMPWCGLQAPSVVNMASLAATTEMSEYVSPRLLQIQYKSLCNIC